MALQAGNHYGPRFLVSVFTLYIGFELQHFNALVLAHCLFTRLGKTIA